MKTHTDGALLCSLVQVVRVVIVRVILVGVRCVTVVHIGHDEVLVVVLKSVAISVVIFCIWRCTLYTLTGTKLELFNCCSHGDPSPLRTFTAVVETEGITRYVCIEVHTLSLAKLLPLAGSAGALSVCVASLKDFTVSVFVQNSSCTAQ